jgi:hypothetical protein
MNRRPDQDDSMPSGPDRPPSIDFSPEHSPDATSDATSDTPNYTVVAQNANELQDIQNAPSVSMARFLVESDQMGLLPTISIYAERGPNRSQVRLLYMNAPALIIWKEMGKQPTEIGVQHRPARTALLAFGMPFSE